MSTRRFKYGIKEMRLLPVALLVLQLIIGSFLLLGSGNCSAQAVEGMAPIIGGDVSRAREQAYREAMRTFVEEKVGVAVNSISQAKMGRVIADRITTESSGYVQVLNIISEGPRGNVYHIILDLKADDVNIHLKYKEDVRKALEAMRDIESRKTANVAVADINAIGGNAGTSEATALMMEYLEAMGIRPVYNEALDKYLLSHPHPETAEMRRIARTEDRLEANSILCGAMKLKNLYSVDGGYAAELEAGFYFVGLDNNYVNAYTNYIAAIGKTEAEAMSKAKRQAASAAAEYLAKAGLETMQLENRGGRHHIVTELQFYGLKNQISSRNTLLTVFQQLNCRIVREAFAPDGTYKLRINATGYDTPGELSVAISQMAQQEGMVIRPIETAKSNGPRLVFSVTDA